MRINVQPKTKDSSIAPPTQERTWPKLQTRPFTEESEAVQAFATPTPQSQSPQPNQQIQREKVARAGFNLANIPLYAPEQTSASPTEQSGIQRQEVEKKDDNLQMKSQAETPEQEEVKKEDIQTKPQAETPQQEEEVKKEEIQTKSEGSTHQQEEEVKKEDIQTKPQAETPQQEEEVKKEDIQTKPQAETSQQEEEVKKEDIQTKSEGSTDQQEEEVKKEDIQTKSEGSTDQQEEEVKKEDKEDIQTKSEGSTDQQEEEVKKEEVQTKSEVETPQQEEEVKKEDIQTKLTVGAPGDKYEQEADSMAAKVMTMPDPASQQRIQRQTGEEQEELQMKPLANSITPLVQRQTGGEQEELQMKPGRQGVATADSAQASPSVESRLGSAKGGGSPLPDDVRSFMEARFGVDFSQVRVHTDSTAVQMNKELGAQAFAHGSDIFYGAGKSPGKDELTAHELTHVVQQTGAKKLQQKPLISRQSNKETLQAKISPAPGAAIQCKQAPDSPQADPAFQAVVNKTKNVAQGQKKHSPAKTKATEAQAAAKPPANEVESKAQDKQVQVMNQQQPGKFNAAGFQAALMQKIAAVAPNTLEEADKFKENNAIDSVKGDVSSQVTNEKKQASSPIEEKTKQPPNTSGITPKPVTPLPPKQASAKPGDVGAAGAAPKPKHNSEVSLQAGCQSLDQQMASANVTEEQLKKSNEPQFQAAVKAKDTAQTHADKAPAGYRQQEQAKLNQAQAQAQTVAQTNLQGMHGGKEQALAKVLGEQNEGKSHDEQKRSEVANRIQGIYNNTKQKVETALSQLDGQVNTQFDQGAAAAKALFENYVDQRMKRYKDERYSGLTGPAKWLKDKLMGMPSEVNAFYQEGKQQYLASMGQTIDKISNFVATKLNAAKAEIAKGRQEIQKYVAGLEPSLRQVGQEAAQNIQGKFDELEQSVDSKQNELIESLAQKYSENLQQLDARIDEMKAANRGLVDKAKDAIGDTIKTINELKNMLMGVLRRAGGVIGKIIQDPIGFLGNLIAGLKQGFLNFKGNIGQHLKQGFMGFLTGAMASTGIQMPESFDMKGIFSLVTQVLGMTYETIRPKAVKRMGEKQVSTLESNFEMFVILKNEGTGGLWKFIQGQIGDLKSMVVDTIQSFIIEKVIVSGITWILSLLNPASAFVRACKAIIDIIMFFIERASQIAELINAVIDAVIAIASGSIGGAAKAIENALSKSLPVVISFMASLLGLGGISDKVQEVIKRVRQPIEKAINWVIEQAVKFAKKLGLGKNKDGKPDERTMGEKQANLDKAVGEAEELMDKEDATPDTINSKLPNIQSKYKLTSLKLVKDNEITYHVEAKINPSRRGEPKKLHKLYRPQNLVKTTQGDGSTEVTYETSVGGKFKVVLGKDEMIKSITGTSLKRKADVGVTDRGYTSDSGRKAKNKDMNASHLIGDQFSGSGYKNSCNLITTSAHYNQFEMKRAEDTIAAFINIKKAKEFDMDVQVSWGQLDNEKIYKEIRNQLSAKYGSMSDSEIKTEIDKNLAGTSENLKRCMSVDYKVQVRSQNGEKNRMPDPPELGPDIWLGT